MSKRNKKLLNKSPVTESETSKEVSKNEDAAPYSM